MTIKIPHQKNNTESFINLLDIARSGSIGPIYIGAHLDEFANIIGPPKSWYFAQDYQNTFCVMRFGVVEAHFRSDGGRLILSYAEIDVSSLHKGAFPFARDQNLNQMRVIVPERRFLRHSALELNLNNEDIPFSSTIDEPVSEETSAVMAFSCGVKFYFAGDQNPVLSVICLS